MTPNRKLPLPLRIVRAAVTLAALTTYAFTVFAGLIGPGGVTMEHGTPPDTYGPATLDRTEFPGCVVPEAFDGIPATSVIVTDRGVARQVPWATAWEWNTDDTTINNVRVLGSCA